MSQEELQQLLNKLRVELNSLDINSDEYHKVNSVIASIENQIEEIEEQQSKSTLKEDLQKYIEKFEVEHPRITGILNDIMVKLGNMGI